MSLTFSPHLYFLLFSQLLPLLSLPFLYHIILLVHYLQLFCSVLSSTINSIYSPLHLFLLSPFSFFYFILHHISLSPAHLISPYFSSLYSVLAHCILSFLMSFFFATLHPIPPQAPFSCHCFNSLLLHCTSLRQLL